MVRIGCFHAHYSNIEHIDNALRGLDVELIHYVDPGLDRIKLDADFTTEMAQKKVLDTLNWIAKSHVDAILMTCTFFTAIYDEDIHRFPIPIIKIDDPLFEEICQLDQPTIVAFTNPSTVQGTMNQLAIYAQKKGIVLEAAPALLANTFDLIMQGKRSEYIQAVTDGLIHLIEENPTKRVVAAQLSMVPAAQAAEKQTKHVVGNQLVSLATYLKEVLAI
jgi:glutamate racemase